MRYSFTILSIQGSHIVLKQRTVQSDVILQAKRRILFLQNVPLLIKKEKKKELTPPSGQKLVFILILRCRWSARMVLYFKEHHQVENVLFTDTSLLILLCSLVSAAVISISLYLCLSLMFKMSQVTLWIFQLKGLLCVYRLALSNYRSARSVAR